MTAAKLTPMANQTLTYNKVQFGGGDSAYTMMPPSYRCSGRFVYDDANRAITHVQYTFSIAAVVYATTQLALSRQIDSMVARLEKPGQKISLKGFGFGFEADPKAIIWGAKPSSVELEPIGGFLATTLRWSVEFSYKRCAVSRYRDVINWMAMNFDETWSYDFEGRCTRTIAGYIQIPQVADGSNNVAVVADQVRDQFVVVVPNGFQRLSQTWHENAAKNRIDFSITDGELEDENEPFPLYCTFASGDFNVASNNRFFVNGSATLNVILNIRKGVHPSFAMAVFLKIALGKQAWLTRQLGGNSERDGGGISVPAGIRVGHKLFSRTSSFSATWLITGSIQKLLLSSGIWEPVEGSNYDQWRSSVESPMWSQRGSSGLQSLPTNDTIVDVCAGKNEHVIAEEADFDRVKVNKDRYDWECPPVPKRWSWLAYDVRMLAKRQDFQTWHRKAAPIVKYAIQSLARLVPGPIYQIPALDTHIVEEHGYPRTQVALQFMGVRLKHHIVLPELKTFGGHPVKYVKTITEGEQVIGEIAGCCVFFQRAAILYEVESGAYIGTYKLYDNPKLSCKDPKLATGKN